MQTRRRQAALFTVGAIVAVAVAVAAAVLTDRYFGDQTSSVSAPVTIPPPPPLETSSPLPSFAPGPIQGAECLVGTWQETSAKVTATLRGTSVDLTWTDRTVRYDTEGTFTIDMTTPATAIGSIGGDLYTLTRTGSVTYRYAVDGETIHYTDAQVTGTQVWRRGSDVVAEEPIPTQADFDEAFRCVGLVLTRNEVRSQRLTF